MNNEVEVGLRAADAEDATAMLKLLKQLESESNFFELDADLDSVTAEQEARQIELMNASGTNLILLATVGDQLIGIATVEQINDSTGELGVAVLNDFQHMGLGTMLVDELINWQENYSNLDQLELEVKKDNSVAIHIYQKLGFEQISETDKTIWMGKNNDYKSL
ncbi:N-acetyltransferase family protein [Fructilactobacillus sp. Tb1]|uniref:GNAT family N-acetyltransferase n=1 Tax=Fructilactobacillus sp. Tb1 TaxID=3422304 RepID=UPI003D26C755